MTQEIEIELKNLLSKTEFKHLYTYLNFPTTPVVQTNYYFETQDLDLKACGAALRIRQKDNTHTLTLKEPHSQGLLETHDTLTADEANQWLNDGGCFKPNTGPQIAKLGIDPYAMTLFGDLTTKRWETDYHGVQVVLDQSFYQEQEDFELEIEGPSKDRVDRTFHELLTTANIPQRDTPNKIKRLFNKLID